MRAASGPVGKGLPFMAAVCGLLWLVVMGSRAPAETPERSASPIRAAANALSASERAGGWRLLFDGVSATDFRLFRGEGLGSGWAIRDGALVLQADGAGDLITKEQFGEFELELEYRIGPGGDSGVLFHVTEAEDAAWKTGPEVQILDNAAGKDSQKSGWLYGLYEPSRSRRLVQAEMNAGIDSPRLKDATRPAGQWNHLALRVTASSSEVFLNGEIYARFVIGSKDWNERVKKSAFADLPDFTKADRGHICLQGHGAEVAFRSIKIRELPGGKPARVRDDGSLPLKAVPAFPEIDWQGWSEESADGSPVVPMRPLVVTHAGDGSGRRFVLDQSGMIHAVSPDGRHGELFLDIRPQTAPWSRANEEGLLGLAFHPRFRDNGEFFVTYVVRTGDAPKAERVERLARFRVRTHDPNRADPATEEVILSITQPFVNHNGGSLTFGADGFLYLGLGDGGSYSDPFDNAQDLGTLLGKILRIDVDHSVGEQRYAIPADNPFVGQAGARPEIFAYGFRNPWQISCDPATGRIWAADVGQDRFEEINIVCPGGNYGWRRLEGTHRFGNMADAQDVIDPIWEYDHLVGRSITGGLVIRGGPLSMLDGRYVYGDHVAGTLWALALEDEAGHVSNKSIPWNGLPVFAFGRDEAGRIYVTTSSANGQGVFVLVNDATAAAWTP